MKYKNKGFTLIEILAVVTIIGLIFILVIPKITTSLKNKKSDVDKTTENLVLSATKLYVSDHSSKFEKTDGNISCMPLHQLVRKGYLDGPVKNVTDDKDITNGKSVRITYDKGFKYELVDSGECKVSYCNSDFCDNDGNGYMELEYIETTGTQYIDLGVKGNQDSRVDFKFQPTQIVQSAGIFGTYDNYGSSCLYIYSSGSLGKFQIGYKNWNDTNIILDTKVYNVTNEKNVFKINEDSYTSPNEGSFETRDNLLLFTINGYYGLPMKLYYFKLFEGDKIVRDLVPTIDKKNEICLFDRVDKKCYYNEGKGSFIMSDKDYNNIYNNISDDELEENYNQIFDYDNKKYYIVNYIETTGTQYINLGVKGNQDSRVDLKFEPTQIAKSRGIFGIYESSKSYYIYSSENLGKFQVGYKGWNNTNINLDTKVYNVTNEKNVFKINEDTYTSPNEESFETSGNLLLFTINGYPGLPMKLYYFKLYNNDTLVRDYIPVIDISRKPCLFDKLENKCYYNQGTSEFRWR